MRFSTLNEINKYRKLRPDLIPVSDNKFEEMKIDLNKDIELFGFS